MRLILVTGGGGAGVSTFAAATALCCARRDLRTTLAATDQTAIASLLGPPESWPVALNARRPSEVELPSGGDVVLSWLASLLQRFGWSDISAAAIPAFPGFRGLIALVAAIEAEPDIAVVDLGPVGESLPLLQALCAAPPVTGPERPADIAGRVVASLAGQIVDLPRPADAVRRAGRQLAARVDRLRGLIRDPERCSLRVVVPPDPRAGPVMTESRTLAGLWGLGLDALAEREGNSRGGAGPPLLTVPASPEPPRGAATLLALGGSVYAARPPERLLVPAPEPRFEARTAAADLVVPLPARPPDGFSVTRQVSALHIRAGLWRRTFHLPSSIQPLPARRAWHDGDLFRVRFEQ